MDYLTKLIEDGVVDSLPNHNAFFVTMSSPSPLRIKMRTTTHILGSNGGSRSFCKFYDIPSSSISCAMVKVFL
jgi:hypothetical protein